MVLTISSILSRSRPSLKFGMHSTIFFIGGNPPSRKHCQPPVISLAQLPKGLKIEDRGSKAKRSGRKFDVFSSLIVHSSLPEPRHSTMTNEQSTMNNEQCLDDHTAKIFRLR